MPLQPNTLHLKFILNGTLPLGKFLATPLDTSVFKRLEPTLDDIFPVYLEKDAVHVVSYLMCIMVHYQSQKNNISKFISTFRINYTAQLFQVSP